MSLNEDSKEPHRPAPPRVTCAICGKQFPPSRVTRLALIRPPLVDLMRADKPDLAADVPICDSDLARYRARYVSDLLRSERGELSKLEEQVVKSLAQGQTLSTNVEEDYADKRGLGERVADKIATFGGSWTFILSFLGFILAWMLVNVIALLRQPFDPYPFILLNLVLSCLAALQAPVIMMSQSRQEAKDRLRSENDFQVNLKAELEIRHLHEKIDHLINKQWERLAEIQEIQLEMMQDQISRRKS
jgi:uncharacterized membrane protein